MHAPTIDATAVSSATHTAGAGPIDIRNPPAVLNNMAAQTPGGAATPDSCSAELHSVVDSCAGHVTCRPHSHSTRCRGRQVVGVSSSTDPVLAPPQVPVAADGCLHLPELRPACILWHIVVTVPLRLTSRQFLIQPPHTAALAARTRSTNEGQAGPPPLQRSTGALSGQCQLSICTAGPLVCTYGNSRWRGPARSLMAEDRGMLYRIFNEGLVQPYTSQQLWS